MQEHWTTWCNEEKNPTYEGTCKWREESNLCRNYDENQLMCSKMKGIHKNICRSFIQTYAWTSNYFMIQINWLLVNETESFPGKSREYLSFYSEFYHFQEIFQSSVCVIIAVERVIVGPFKFSKKPCFFRDQIYILQACKPIRSVELNDADSIFHLDEWWISVNWLGKSSFE